MLPSFTELPDTNRYVLRNATLPKAIVSGYSAPGHEGLIGADIVISDAKIEAIVAPGSGPTDLPGIDLRDGQVWPCFTDMHTHLDKGHIWPRAANPDGTFIGAIDAAHGDAEVNWNAKDLTARMDFSLRSAYAHGTKLMRTHLDSLSPHISWPVVAEMRDKWAGRIDLQAVALFNFDRFDEDDFFDDLIAQIVDHKGVLGGFPQMSPELDSQLDIVFKAAMDNGLDIDLHVDENPDPESKMLLAVAEAALRHKYDGQVVVGHCCSLACQDEDEAARTIDKVVEAKLAVVSLPMCNMYLQDRKAGVTPRWRGVTLLQELQKAGALTAIASDNVRDPFFAYGDMDPVEVFREGVRILHLDHPLDEAAKLITVNPSLAIGCSTVGTIAAGGPADLVLFNARSWTEFLSRPQADRVVMRNGKAIDRTLPDYRELDELFGGTDG